MTPSHFWTAGLRGLVLVTALGATTGCSGCEGGSGADRAKKVAAEQEEGVKPWKGKVAPHPKKSRSAMRELRRLEMRVRAAEEPERTLAPEVEQARSLVEQGTREAAIEATTALTTWLGEHAEDGDAHYWLGRAHLVAEERGKSVESFEAAVGHDPSIHIAYRWAALAHFERDACDAAMEHLDTAVRLEPHNPDVYVDRIVCAIRTQAWDVVYADAKLLCAREQEMFCDALPVVEDVRDRRTAQSKRRAAKAANGGEERVEKMRQAGKLGKGGKLGKLGKRGKFGNTLGIRGKAKSPSADKQPVEAEPVDEAGTTEE